MIKRYYNVYTLAYASYCKERLSSVRAPSSRWPLMGRSAPDRISMAGRGRTGRGWGVVSTASYAGRRIAGPALDYAPPWAADSLALRDPPSPGIISAAW